MIPDPVTPPSDPRPPAPERAHPLLQLRGRALGPYRLEVSLGRKSRFGAQYFQVALANRDGCQGEQPVVAGAFNSGPYPSHNWIEVIGYNSRVQFASGSPPVADVIEEGLEEPLFRALCDLIPSGGHMMVEYESPERRQTVQSLLLGLPPVATPLGYLLFSVGCGVAFKDWYIAEGGMEGPRKLQGYKALNDQHARDRAPTMAAELERFLAAPPGTWPPEYQEPARGLAQRVLARLQTQYPV